MNSYLQAFTGLIMGLVVLAVTAVCMHGSEKEGQ